MYYENIRPHHIGDRDCNHFFISSSGMKLKSVTNDVALFKERYVQMLYTAGILADSLLLFCVYAMGITFSLTDTVNTFSCHILLLQLQGQTEHQPGDPADYGDTGSCKIHRRTAAARGSLPGSLRCPGKCTLQNEGLQHCSGHSKPAGLLGGVGLFISSYTP